MNTIQSWSGGKDSTASIILEHINNLPKSRIMFVEVIFDHKRGISGELPEHIDFVKNIAIPKFESWGYTVDVISDDSDYIQEFYQIVTKSKIAERNGKYHGFFIGGMCAGNSRLKMRPIHRYYKQYPNANHIVGIAIDEPKRLERLKNNEYSLLAKYNYTEQMAYDLCKQYDLLSPIYAHNRRGGCWFCPNQSIDSFANLKEKHPNLWAELEHLSKVKNTISGHFKYLKTFNEVALEVDGLLEQKKMAENQLSFFEV